MPRGGFELVSGLHDFRRKYGDWVLTLMTVFARAGDIRLRAAAGEGFLRVPGICIAGLLLIIGGVVVISERPMAVAVMSIAFVANVVVFVLRLFQPPWPYNLHLLTAAWLVIAISLGTVVAEAVFGRGRINYHRIVGAVLLYLLIAVGFGALFAFIGLSIPGSFKGIAFEDNGALASDVFYLSFATLTTTGFGDVVPVYPLARSLCNMEAIVGQLFPATLLARVVTLELRGR